MQKINQKIIAKKFGVSVSTVSRAMNDSHQISEPVKKKINSYIKKIKFQPNPHARSLRNMKTKTIAVLVPDIANSFFTLSLRGIEEVLHKNGYNLMIFQTNDQLETEKQIFNQLESGIVDGVLSACSSNKNGAIEHIMKLNEKIPVVFFDRFLKELPIPYVTTNNFEVSIEATDAILKECTDVFFVGISEKISVTAERLMGYKTALSHNKIAFDPKKILMFEDEASAYKKFKILLQNRKNKSAFFSTVERYTMELYKVCTELNIKVPDDIAIISFTNHPYIHLFMPNMPIVSMPSFDMGKMSTEILLTLIKKKKLLKPNYILPSTILY
ncbi:MAG: LacI family DNA-binding transcriptional regulator [Sphingobacteriia bacterium]|nr:LacI family DNA-binding transcriptional regulator [Sphingobacteriia bacterium]